jgi:ABC-type transport system involved in cytochrome bd biosynthesis fused ATPase/permease subunit
LPDGCDQLLGENGLQISGGEKQRILIARALYHQPEWLFLDEPFTGIDIENQIEIKNLLESLREKNTIVLITHQKVPSLTVDKVINLDQL